MELQINRELEQKREELFECYYNFIDEIAYSINKSFDTYKNFHSIINKNKIDITIELTDKRKAELKPIIINILKSDGIYSVCTKKNATIENNSFNGYPADQEYIFKLISSCLPNEKFKFFILTDLIRLIPIIINEESIRVTMQLKAQIPNDPQLPYLISQP